MALDTGAKVKLAVRQSYVGLPWGPQLKSTGVQAVSVVGINGWDSQWTSTLLGGGLWLPGATPATGVGETVDDTTVGAFPIPPAVGGLTRYLVRARARGDTNDWLVVTLIDRLVQTSGLVTNVATAQTVNTVALPTRATGGDEVWAALETYTSSSAVGSNATISYTNQAGTAGRTSGAITINSGVSRQFVVFPLQAGDSGVRSVQSLTFAGAGTNAGNFGITLFRPLLSALVGPNDNVDPTPDWSRDWRTLMTQIPDACCLAALARSNSGAPKLWLDLGFAFA